MLSVAKVGSAGGAANYYSQEDNYYFLGEQSTKWFGEGAKRLGLEGAVDKDTFKQVLEGRLPDGSDLSHIRNGENVHRAGYDYTFSAPKSVSLLALIQGDKDVLNAHKSAVEKVMTEIESLASTRSMETQEKDIVETKNLVSALFYTIPIEILSHTCIHTRLWPMQPMMKIPKNSKHFQPIRPAIQKDL